MRLPVRAHFVSAQKALEAGAGVFPDVVGHAVVDERIEALGDHPLAVDDGTHQPDLVGVVSGPAVPDLVVEHVDIARFRDKGHRLPAFEGRIFAVVRVSAGEVAARNDLGDAVFDGIGPAERDHHVDHETGDGDIRIVARDAIGKRELDLIVQVPPAALAGS